MNTDFYNLLIAVITAVIIVLAMNLVGSLLISALVIFPALSAMRMFRTFLKVTICSAALSVTCALVGILLSVLAGTPVGSTIVATDLAEEPEESVQEDYQEEAEQEQSEKWDLSQEDEWMPEDQPLEETASDTGVDYDLTQMNGDMVYATVYQMMADPSTYEGKTFRMEGLYTPIIVEDTGKIYHYCLIQDALACCAQGMEIVLGDGSHTDKSEYPPEDTDIIVEGTFETYREEDDENLYCRLANATMEVVQ